MRDRAIWFGADPGRPLQADPTGRLLARIGAATGLVVDAAIADAGIVYLLEDWLRPHLDGDALERMLESWWPPFPRRFSTAPADAGCPRRCAHSSISSGHGRASNPHSHGQ